MDEAPIFNNQLQQAVRYVPAAELERYPPFLRVIISYRYFTMY